MKTRDVLLFLSLFAVFFALLNVSFSPHRQQLKLCTPYKVTGLQILTKTRTLKADLNLDTGRWWVSSKNLQAPGDSPTIKTVTNLVCLMPYVEEFTLEPSQAEAELKAFGLTDTNKKVIVSTEDKQQTLEIGNNTPSGTEFYLRTSQNPNTVYTITNTLKKSLFLLFFDLRSHAPFAELSDGKELNLRFGASELSLIKEDSGWREKNQRINAEQSEQIIKLLQSFVYTNYKTKLTPQELLSYGLDFPDVTLEWKQPGHEQSELFKIITFNYFYNLAINVGNKTYILILDTKAPTELFKILEMLSTQTPTPVVH